MKYWPDYVKSKGIIKDISVIYFFQRYVYLFVVELKKFSSASSSRVLVPFEHHRQPKKCAQKKLFQHLSYAYFL